MNLSRLLALSALCLSISAPAVGAPKAVADEEQALLQLDKSIFGSGSASAALAGSLLEPRLTWTNTLGITYNKSEILKVLRYRQGISEQTPIPKEDGTEKIVTQVRTHGDVGVVQEQQGNLYVLRVWIKRASNWRLFVYQAVSIGAPPSADSGVSECENPCKTVPFVPNNQDEADVIHGYQSVERAVTAHDSAAWGAHIADEFFAVTSNSNRPLDKATRMAGLDNQKVAGIPPFPLASARMYEFGDAMVMVSTQQPEHGDPLHVTRVWFKRNGTWLEAYSYQTTIGNIRSVR